jgi:hypothetical protein
MHIHEGIRVCISYRAMQSKYIPSFMGKYVNLSQIIKIFYITIEILRVIAKSRDDRAPFH